MDKLLYGAAYYDEYMPSDRLEEDMKLMKAAGLNVIRIAESTWATEEPENGRFDFTHAERVLQAAQKNGIDIIVGTPTYAIPPWLAAEHPEVLAVTERGPGKYGARQNMDITAPAYLFHAERVIRRLLACVQKYPNVIGFQIDNETKHYHTCGPNVLKQFAKYMREKFGTVEKMNRAFGFNYWSNRVDSWENLPDPTGTINASYAGEFEKFRRGLVTQFLLWQRHIVDEYRKPHQFVTQNFDYEWRDHSYGIQPDVDHKAAAEAVTIAGVDIYHKSQDDLTGMEIAFGGDVNRSLKDSNYFVIETQAQGHTDWTPYAGQLRLQAFSHLASGANCVMYWHWHSIHNAMETYWKGILSHDLQPNAPYQEVCTIGADFARLSNKLIDLKKRNRVAILISNESLTALNHFSLALPGRQMNYNDVFRRVYDALYEMNVECDILFPCDGDKLSRYTMVVAPALYSAPDALLDALSVYVKQGGHLVATFKTGFADEHLTVRTETQPGRLSECFGIRYDEFTEPKDVGLTGDSFALDNADRQIDTWMELVTPGSAKVLARYDHKFWGNYAAVTENQYGSGSATYIACLPHKNYMKQILQTVLRNAGLWGAEQSVCFPVIIKSGVNRAGNEIHYYFNYSGDVIQQTYLHGKATELLSGKRTEANEKITLKPWGFFVFEEEKEG